MGVSLREINQLFFPLFNMDLLAVESMSNWYAEMIAVNSFDKTNSLEADEIGT